MWVEFELRTCSISNDPNRAQTQIIPMFLAYSIPVSGKHWSKLLINHLQLKVNYKNPQTLKIQVCLFVNFSSYSDQHWLECWSVCRWLHLAPLSTPLCSTLNRYPAIFLGQIPPLMVLERTIIICEIKNKNQIFYGTKILNSSK